MLELSSVVEGKQSTITKDLHFSEDASFSENNLTSNMAIHKAKRRVQFSSPLEYWREFDKETGEVYELKDLKIAEGEGMKQPLKNIETYDNDQSKNAQKGVPKTQSITDVIQAFQKRQYKRIDVSKQTQEKRQDFSAVQKRNVKPSSGSLHTKQLKHGRLLCNVSTCSKLANDGEFLLNLREKPSLIQSYCTYSFSSSMGMLTGFKVSPLPLVSTSSKLYDERLLPRTAFGTVDRKYSSIRTARNDGGLPSVFGKSSTPYIVQLFD
ncbi:uncharacterized protein LOC144653966 [Oculina patagonica]